MQYEPYAMNVPGQNYQILTPLQPGATIGDAQRLSTSDITEVQRLYNC